jgi:hypothetical protein
MTAMGLEFVDLTLEPPAAASWRVAPHAIARRCRSTGGRWCMGAWRSGWTFIQRAPTVLKISRHRRSSQYRGAAKVFHGAAHGQVESRVSGDYNTASQPGELLDPLPELALHLEIGPANLEVRSNTSGEILAVYGSRLRHVHLRQQGGPSGPAPGAGRGHAGSRRRRWRPPPRGL